MKISILSDLHIDFHIPQKDPNRIKDHVVYDTFCDFLDAREEVPVLVMAGDAGHYNAQDFAVLEAIARVFSYKKIFIVAGNHTLYRSSKHSTIERITGFWGYKSDVIEVLNGNVVEYNGVKFGGATGWAYGRPYMQKVLQMEGMTQEEADTHYRYGMNDMSYIDGLTSSKDMFDTELEKILSVYKDVDIMVTHYNPTMRAEGIQKQFRADPVTGFYVMDLEDTVKDSSAKLWVHGHQHTRHSYQVCDSTVVCNAMGYPSESSSTRKMTIEV